MSASGEVGEGDNRLSLNPNDPQWQDSVGEWQDGKEYVFEQVRVRQESPGEFTVISAKPQAEEAEAADNATEEASEQPSPEAGPQAEYPNPAIDRMMKGPKQ